MVEDDSDSIQTPTRTHDSTQYLIWTCRSDTDACSICLKRYHRLRIILPLSVKQNSVQFHLMPAEHLILRRPSGFWPASLSAVWSTGQDPVHTHEETNSPSSGCPPPLPHKLTPTVFQKDSESRKMMMMKDLHRGLQCRDEYVELKVGCM